MNRPPFCFLGLFCARKANKQKVLLVGKPWNKNLRKTNKKSKLSQLSSYAATSRERPHPTADCALCAAELPVVSLASLSWATSTLLRHFLRSKTRGEEERVRHPRGKPRKNQEKPRFGRPKNQFALEFSNGSKCFFIFSQCAPACVLRVVSGGKPLHLQRFLVISNHRLMFGFNSLTANKIPNKTQEPFGRRVHQGSVK